MTIGSVWKFVRLLDKTRRPPLPTLALVLLLICGCGGGGGSGGSSGGGDGSGIPGGGGGGSGIPGGGGGGSGGGPPSTYTVGGTVSGLSGTGLVLQDNGGHNLTVSGNGIFTFAMVVVSGVAYNVTILTQPSSPTQTCEVKSGFGTVASANILSVQVSCNSGAFTLTGSMPTTRLGHTATLLNNGKVLTTGGEANWNSPISPILSSAELYDPVAGNFMATGSMTIARIGHTATLLNNGKVLIAGGLSPPSDFSVTSAELYDPVAGTFMATGSMTIARIGHTATLLNNGKVLIVGGGDGNGSIFASAELYDPVAETFTAIGSMTGPRIYQTATQLNNGKVLITGGQNTSVTQSSSELYDPVTRNFTATGSMTTARLQHKATLLNNGMVLISAGAYYSYSPLRRNILASAELYEPVAGTFTATGSMTTARVTNTATLLNNGMVLITGGDNIDIPNNFFVILAKVELFDPVAGTFTTIASMTAPRSAHTATLLNNGMLLVAGGQANNGSGLASAELFLY